MLGNLTLDLFTKGEKLIEDVRPIVFLLLDIGAV